MGLSTCVLASGLHQLRLDRSTHTSDGTATTEAHSHLAHISGLELSALLIVCSASWPFVGDSITRDSAPVLMLTSVFVFIASAASTRSLVRTLWLSCFISTLEDSSL